MAKDDQNASHQDAYLAGKQAAQQAAQQATHDAKHQDVSERAVKKVAADKKTNDKEDAPTLEAPKKDQGNSKKKDATPEQQVMEMMKDLKKVVADINGVTTGAAKDAMQSMKDRPSIKKLDEALDKAKDFLDKKAGEMASNLSNSKGGQLFKEGAAALSGLKGAAGGAVGALFDAGVNAAAKALMKFAGNDSSPTPTPTKSQAKDNAPAPAQANSQAKDNAPAQQQTQTPSDGTGPQAQPTASAAKDDSMSIVEGTKLAGNTTVGHLADAVVKTNSGESGAASPAPAPQLNQNSDEEAQKGDDQDFQKKESVSLAQEQTASASQEQTASAAQEQTKSMAQEMAPVAAMSVPANTSDEQPTAQAQAIADNSPADSQQAQVSAQLAADNKASDDEKTPSFSPSM